MLDNDSHHIELWEANVASYPATDFSRNAIERAGQIISADDLFFSGTPPQELQDAFLIANSWRDAHAFPMKSVRGAVSAYMRANNFDGITAARLKRMQSIRAKLRRPEIVSGLDQLQDLGGCRAILSNISEVRSLIAILKDRLPNSGLKEAAYIDNPKEDGYRCHHMIFRYKGRKTDIHDGKRIELQIRTKLQHSWATAIEAVGLFIGEELKNNQGDQDWLRLFKLMSAEFASTEGCPIPSGIPDPAQRKAEIRNLVKSLDAVMFLESINNGVRGTDAPLSPDYTPKHYLIRYDYIEKKVYVEPHRETATATSSLDQIEAELRDKEKDVIVLVEVDKIKNLKKAYPNYFGDVSFFSDQLKEISLGGSAIEFSSAPKVAAPKKLPEVILDPSWLYGTRFRKPSLKQKK
ncbi:MAG: RelA/SpoT domain-containing protein [Micavibrio aeruginosavorus]|nr:RelA/SpoT domain-containing protein [Micavibrio aeruginosavorus]